MAPIPPDLDQVLATDAAAKAQWDSLTDLGRRDFISWIDSAKQPETRKRRVDSVPSRLASGKKRPCCYAVVPLELHTALGQALNAKANWKALSADHKRDFNDWVAAAANKRERSERAARAVVLIGAGETGPQVD